jgi:hypothetical protein
MDQDGSLAISFDEWRDFLLYAPSTDIIEILKYWRHSTVGDYFTGCTESIIATYIGTSVSVL